MILNTIAGALAAVEVALPHLIVFLGTPEPREILPEGWIPYYALALALMNFWLRTITDTAFGRSG